jgi:hypothetical protein
MNIISVFSLVGLLAAFGLGTVSSQHAIGSSPGRSTGLASGLAGAAQLRPRPSDVVGTKSVRHPLDTVGGTPAH